MFSLCSQQFLLLLVVTTCHLFLVADAWAFTTKGKIEKKYDMNYVGENLTVFCIKTLDFTGDVYFQQGNVNYSQEYVTQINTKHALLDKPVTADDFKQTILTCADSEGVVATAVMYTDYAPQNATDRKMVWLDEVNLFINWGFNNTPYKNGHSERLILVTGEWSFNASNESSWRECYRGKLNDATCKIINFTSNEWATVYVRVNITNVKRNDLVSTVFPGLLIRDQVKPLPVESVQVTALNGTAVRVNVTSVYYQQVYNITYYTTSGKEESHTTVMTAKTAVKSFVVTGLHPDYHYRFSVSSKYDTDRGYLSDPFDSETRMPEDAPAAGPVVTPGGFYLDPCSSEADSAKKKSTAYVYFQELAYEDKNGEIVRYTATVVVDGTDVTYTQSGTPRTVKLDSVPCDGNFDVTLHAHTAVGPSPGAVLHVPRWSEGNDGGVDKLMLKQSDGKITAEWEATPSLPGVSVLLYYCDKTSADPNMCQDSIRYVNISTDSGSHLLPNANANMKFGMAAIWKDSSTKGIKTNGIQFTDCLYDPTTDPGNILEVSAFAQSDGILVSWKALSACDSARRFIIFNFEIEVCNTETRPSDPDRCKMYWVAASRNSYRLGDVAKDVNYSVRMKANTTSANQPLTEFTDPVFATVQSTIFKLSSGEIAGIVAGVLGVVFVMGVLVFCFCRDKFRALRSKFKKPADIVNPPVIQPPKKIAPSDGHVNQAYVVTSSPKVVHEQQVSGDSGYSGNNDNNDSPPHSPTEDKTQVIPESRPDGYHMVTSTSGQNPYMPNADTAGLITPSADQADVSGIVLSVANQPLGQSQGLLFPLPVPACCQEDDDKDDDKDKDSDKDKDECVSDDSRASESGNEAYMRCSTADTIPDDAQPPGASTASDTTLPAARPDPAVINFVQADLPAIPVLEDFLHQPDLEDEDGALKEAGPRSEHNSAADSTLQDNYMRLAAASDTTEPGQDHVQQLTAQPGVEASFSPSGDKHPTAPQDTEHLLKSALLAGDGNGLGYIETCGPALQRSPLSSPNVESTQEVEACTPQEGAVNPGYVPKETIASHSHTYPANQPEGKDESQQSPQAEILRIGLSASTSNPLPSTRSEPSCDESPAASECEGWNPEASRQQPPSPLAPPSTAGYLPHPLPPLPAADPQSGPSQRHAEQGGGNDLDSNLNLDLATQGQPDEVAEDTPLPSAISSGYVARPEEICDVPQPSSQPVAQERGGGEEGSARPVAEDAAQCEGSDSGASSMSDAEHSLSSNGSGYVPHQVTLTPSDGLQSPLNSSVRIEVTGDMPSTNSTSYVPLEVTLTPGSGGLRQPDDASEDPGNRLALERLDSGYFSPCTTRSAKPLFSSDSGQDKVLSVDHDHQAHDTDPSSTLSDEDGGTLTTGEGVGGERQGGTLGGTLIMSGQARLTSSGYVERKDAPSATSTTSV